MSNEAIRWALRDAPGVPPHCVGLLFGLAFHADKQGRGAFASQATLADYARKSDRSIRADLTELTVRGLIREGDQSEAEHIPADTRPVVYDLAMERKHTSGSDRNPTSGGRRKATSGRNPASGRSGTGETGPEQPELPGTGSVLPAGSTASRERKHTSDKTSTKPSPTEKVLKHAAADALVVAFWDVHKASCAQSFIAIRGIVRTAIANGMPRNDVAWALDALAREHRAISGGSITNAIGQRINGGRRNGQSKWAPGSGPRLDPNIRYDSEEDIVI